MKRFHGILRVLLPILVLDVVLTSPYLVHSQMVTSAAAAEKPVSEYAVKVAYLYNFTKFVEWPGQPPSNINLCIAGDDPFGAELNTLQKASINIIRNVPDAQFSQCNILFISASEETRVSRILQSVASAPVLTVSEIKNFAKLGGHIGFVTVKEGLAAKEKLRLEINLKSAALSQLKINANLLEIAQNVFRE